MMIGFCVCTGPFVTCVSLYIMSREKKNKVCVHAKRKNVAPLLLLLTKLIKEQVGSSLLLCFFFF